MTARSVERWHRVQSVLDATLDLAPEQRRSHIAAACGDDAALRAEVERILAAMDPEDDFLAHAAAEYAAPLIATSMLRRPGLAPDTRIGTYRIVREIGRGGMAIVYQAEDLERAGDVAIKVFRPEFARTVGADRFLREIAVCSMLHHPNVLAFLDSGQVSSAPYYVMPLLTGGTLRDLLVKEERLPHADAVRLGAEVGAALEHAHEHGIIHRDIKPENILLEAPPAGSRAAVGRAVVADFGIARALEQRDDERLTATGVSVGTPAYMSPEQMHGDPTLDARADIYSLGCVLFEMLTGAPPYDRAEQRVILAGRRVPEPPGKRLRRLVGRVALEPVIGRALAYDRRERFGSAAELVQALGRLR